MRDRLPTIDAVWLAMPLFVVVIRTLLQPVTPEDYWFAVAFGDAIRGGEFPDANVFMYTVPPDTPWYDQAWLGQLAMALLAEHIGHVANYFAHIALLVTAWGALLYAGLRRGAAPIVLGIAAAATHYMAANGLMVRTQMFAYPLFVLFLAVLLEVLREPRRWHVPVLIVSTIIWANVHGTFVLAPLLAGAAFVGAGIHDWRAGAPRADILIGFGVPLVGIVLATMISPGGLDNLLYPLTIAAATKGETFVVEWVPPELLSPQGGLFWLLLVGSVAFAIWKRRNFTVAELLIFAGVSLITVTSVRAILWWGFTFTLIFTPKITAAFADQLQRDDETSLTSGLINAGILVAFVTTCALALPGGPVFEAVDTAALYGRDRLKSDDPSLRVFSADSPIELARRVVEETDGRLFHHQHAGGLLDYWLLRKSGLLADSPAYVFIDQRIELTTPDQWQQYFGISQAKPGWREAVERYEIVAMLLHPSEQAPLIEELRASGEWEVVGEGDGWTAFVRREGEAG